MTTDISLLFARDPHGLTTEDIDEIIRAIRNRRTAFGKPSASAKPKASKKPTKKEQLIGGLDLDISI